MPLRYAIWWPWRTRNVSQMTKQNAACTNMSVSLWKKKQTKPNQTLAPSQSQFLVTYFASEFYLGLCFFPACPPQTPALATLTNLMPVTKKLREADALALVGCHKDPVPNSILHILM